MAKKISYFHPGEPNARSFQCGTDSLHGSLSICPLECRINRLHKRIQSTRSTVGYLINYKRLDNLLFQMYRERREKNYLNSGTFGLIYRQSNFRLSNSINLHSFISLRLGSVIEHNRTIVPLPGHSGYFQ